MFSLFIIRITRVSQCANNIIDEKLIKCQVLNLFLHLNRLFNILGKIIIEFDLIKLSHRHRIFKAAGYLFIHLLTFKLANKCITPLIPQIIDFQRAHVLEPLLSSFRKHCVGVILTGCYHNVTLLYAVI